MRGPQVLEMVVEGKGAATWPGPGTPRGGCRLWDAFQLLLRAELSPQHQSRIFFNDRRNGRIWLGLLFFLLLFFYASFVLNRFFVIFFSREHEKEVQNRKRGKRPRGRPRKHVVSPGGAGNPQQRQPWRGSDPEGHQRVSVPQHGVMGAEPTEGGKDTAVPADPVVEALQSACSLTHFMAEAA